MRGRLVLQYAPTRFVPMLVAALGGLCDLAATFVADAWLHHARAWLLRRPCPFIIVRLATSCRDGTRTDTDIPWIAFALPTKLPAGVACRMSRATATGIVPSDVALRAKNLGPRHDVAQTPEASRG